jgi:copper transporter 1
MRVNAGADVLWFDGWQPTSAGATVGVTIALFCLAAFSRLFAAIRTGVEVAWCQSALDDNCAAPPTIALDQRSSTSSSEKDHEMSVLNKSGDAQVVPAPRPPSRRLVPKFMLGRELARGAMQMFQAFLGFMLMLAFMMAKCVFFVTSCHS